MTIDAHASLEREILTISDQISNQLNQGENKLALQDMINHRNHLIAALAIVSAIDELRSAIEISTRAREHAL